MEMIRLVELPSCKMVSSGVCEDFGLSDELDKFSDWWKHKEQFRQDRFYHRDFLWYDAENKGFVWYYAMYPGLDPEGHAVVDFSGGLYAVSSYRDGDDDDNMGTYNRVITWVHDSDGFEIDSSRPALGQIVSPHVEKVIEALGYEQMDCYVPIKLKHNIDISLSGF